MRRPTPSKWAFCLEEANDEPKNALGERVRSRNIDDQSRLVRAQEAREKFQDTACKDVFSRDRHDHVKYRMTKARTPMPYMELQQLCELLIQSGMADRFPA